MTCNLARSMLGMSDLFDLFCPVNCHIVVLILSCRSVISVCICLESACLFASL